MDIKQGGNMKKILYENYIGPYHYYIEYKSGIFNVKSNFSGMDTSDYEIEFSGSYDKCKQYIDNLWIECNSEF